MARSRWVEARKCVGVGRAELLEQRKLRLDTQLQMVGGLYPRIIQREVDDINDMLDHLCPTCGKPR